METRHEWIRITTTKLGQECHTATYGFTTTKHGQIESVDPAWLERIGYTIADLNDSAWLNKIHPDEVVEVCRKWFVAISMRSSCHLRHRILSGGRWITVESYAEPQFDERGEFTGHAGRIMLVSDWTN